MASGLYLYGIFPAPGPHNLQITGLDQQRVCDREIDGFVFLYSEAQQERYSASRKNLLGHEQVLEYAMQQGFRTLLPLQFGLIIENWKIVKQQLITPKRQELYQLFTKLTGRREVSIKLFWDFKQELNFLMQEDQAVRIERDRLEGKNLSIEEIIRIGQSIERAMEQRKQEIITTVQHTLNPLAIELAENRLLTDAMIYNAAYLIPWDAETRFSEQVETIDRQFEHRLLIRYNNFTAPFNFAHLDQN
ncbi:gas vesicle protein GvpF [Thermocoleostomius sinensis]|uniref:GvpL/GvpF family gas vesicle protein n=1 Tax=Thermocoleostomius sinensis A174 TaxID=2016057 RepID=A0A9E8Z9Y7_9CYAN|nr:GvpL/GvpF family gas vesicle protein [Thermocoleostomius sinensis]WAL59278.1 GvpL/GvpF family gas vesicle protein [Thermocoleostomius sinensis A174]